MMDTTGEQSKVHDIRTDPGSDPDSGTTEQSPVRRRNSSLSGPLNYARPRPYHIPRVVSQSYVQFKGKQECALRIGVHDLEKEIERSTGVLLLEMSEEKLTVQRHSQSKLSQQELSDLQKATHFDKKELQQWYKGTWGVSCRWTGRSDES